MNKGSQPVTTKKLFLDIFENIPFIYRSLTIFSTIIIMIQFVSPISIIPATQINTSRNVIFWDEMSISNTVQMKDETIICTGNLTILNGGNLTLINSTLLIESPSNISRTLTILNGGFLGLQSSRLDSNNSYGYIIAFESQSIGRFNSSVVSGFGYYCYTDIFTGLQVNNSDLQILDSILYITGNGIVARDGNISIINSTFYPNHFDPDSGEIDCLSPFYGYYSNFIIDNCSFYGVKNITQDNDTIGRSSIRGFFNIKNSKFTQMRTSFIAIDSSSLIADSVFSANYTSQINLPIFNVQEKPLMIINCTIINGKGAAVGCGRTNFTLINSSIKGIPGLTLDPNIIQTTIYLVNSTLNSYLIQNDVDKIFDIRFFDIEVISQKSLTGLENATIQIFDNNGKLTISNQTGYHGIIRDLQVLYKTIQKQTTTYFSNHQIRVTKDNGVMPDIQFDVNIERNITILFDDVAPFLYIVYPPDGLLTNASEINILGTTETDSRLTIDNRTISINKGQINYTYSLNDGQNTIMIRSIDAVGNIQTICRNVTSIRWLPSLRIFSPEDMTVTNTPYITISGWTNGTRVEINQIPVEIDVFGNFSFVYNFSTEGIQTITIRTWNIVNVSEYIRLRVTYDITPPEIIILSPSNGSLLNNPSIIIMGETIGASYLEINSSSIMLLRDGTFSLDAFLHEGLNVFEIRAWDAVRNQINTSFILFLDTLIWIDVSEPQDNVLTRLQDITIAGRTEPGASIKMNGQLINNTNGTFSSVLHFLEGKWTILINSTDLAGNSIQHSINVTIDITPPNITILAPLVKISNQTKILLIVHSESNINITVNGSMMIQAGNGNYTQSLNLNIGSNNFTIQAIDKAGNNMSTIMEIIYEPLKEPQPNHHDGNDNNQWWYLIIGISVIVISIVIILVFQRHKNHRIKKQS